MIKIKESICEGYLPDRFSPLPEKIRLYHGTDYYGITGVMESGVMDAKSGKRWGETYGVNFFTVNGDRLSFSKGYAFSIDVDAEDFRNGTFQFMNDSDVACYDAVDVRNRNFTIVEAFGWKIGRLGEVLENCIGNAGNVDDGRWKFYRFCMKDADRFPGGGTIDAVDDALFVKIMEQLGVSYDEWIESVYKANDVKEEKNMEKKNVIRLSESRISEIVSNAVRSAMNEDVEDVYGDISKYIIDYVKQAVEQSDDWMESDMYYNDPGDVVLPFEYEGQSQVDGVSFVFGIGGTAKGYERKQPADRNSPEWSEVTVESVSVEWIDVYDASSEEKMPEVEEMVRNHFNG